MVLIKNDSLEIRRMCLSAYGMKRVDVFSRFNFEVGDMLYDLLR